jgi:uncharacterized membrane protein YphA (DoxX/SURF4 family)
VSFLKDRRLVLVLRVALGVLFIAAALPKIADPAGFATSVSHYRMLPEWIERVLALVLPPLELVLGICLVVGVLDAGAAFLAFVLLVVFTGAIGTAMGRGLDISCGCFDTEGGSKVGLSKLGENVLFIAASWLVLVGDRSLLSLRARLSRTVDPE